MICKQCGNRISDDSIFCEFCGCKLEDLILPAENPASEDIAVQEIIAPEDTAIKNDNVRTKKNIPIPKRLLVIGAAAGVIVITALFLIFGSHDEAQTVPDKAVPHEDIESETSSPDTEDKSDYQIVAKTDEESNQSPQEESLEPENADTTQAETVETNQAVKETEATDNTEKQEVSQPLSNNSVVEGVVYPENGTIKEVNGVTYQYRDDFKGYMLKKCEGSEDGTLVVESYIDGVPVRLIGGSSVRNIKKITIPSTVVFIGPSFHLSFYDLEEIVLESNEYYHVKNNCLLNQSGTKCVTIIGKDIETLEIPEGVEEIQCEIYGCNKLKTIILPKTYQVYSTRGIDNCFFPLDNLEEIIVSADSPYYTSVDGVLFTKDMKTLVCYPGHKAMDEYVIPRTVESLCSQAFCICDRLKSVYIPKEVQTLPGWAIARTSRITIRCEVDSKPDGWADTWYAYATDIRWSQTL